jgi:hypothetical protein
LNTLFLLVAAAVKETLAVEHLPLEAELVDIGLLQLGNFLEGRHLLNQLSLDPEEHNIL